MTIPSKNEKDQQDTGRLDKWLWSARFYKTRPLATEAISGGKVHLNGLRTKPGRTLNMGDTLEIRKGPYLFTVTVIGFSKRRGPAKEAATLYEETEESLHKREDTALALKTMATTHTSHRPNKKERRDLNRFYEKQSRSNRLT